MACSKDELQRIASIATELSFTGGTVLAAEGHAGHEFMIITEGTAEVSVRGKVVSKLGPDDFFGEVALLDGGPRSATVTATSDVVVKAIEEREFSLLVHESPSIARKLLVAVARRLRAADLRLVE